MGWRRGELWLETDLWLPQGSAAPALAALPVPFALSEPPGLAASRRRRETRMRSRHARRARASAIALSPAVTLMLAVLRADSGRSVSFAVEDPPTLAFPFSNGIPFSTGLVALGEGVATPERAHPRVVWHHARSVGLPYGGSLLDGTELPIEGSTWVTWNPITDKSPNEPQRLYGNEHTIRAILSVTRAYRAAHPRAARVVIGDLSRPSGGPMDDHVSHQNGLDVDVYLPRRDRRLRAPTTGSQIDHRLAQDLLDQFVAAGAQYVFIGYSTGLRGPAGIVVPWPGHEYHMHVRFTLSG